MIYIYIYNKLNPTITKIFNSVNSFLAVIKTDFTLLKKKLNLHKYLWSV